VRVSPAEDGIEDGIATGINGLGPVDRHGKLSENELPLLFVFKVDHLLVHHSPVSSHTYTHNAARLA
jgi:hypothetical protein